MLLFSLIVTEKFMKLSHISLGEYFISAALLTALKVHNVRSLVENTTQKIDLTVNRM